MFTQSTTNTETKKKYTTMNIYTMLAVFLGGGLGSALRFAASNMIGKIGSFPMATFCVNIIGSFLIGAFAAWTANADVRPETKAFLIAGLCGGLTTFSTFCRENFDMLANGQYQSFIIYTLASLAVGLLAVTGGYALLK